MLPKPEVPKFSREELKEVFTIRKKIGHYSKISLETKINLINEFEKVVQLFYFIFLLS